MIAEEPSTSTGLQPMSFGDLSSADENQLLLSPSRGCCTIRPEKDPVVLLMVQYAGPSSARLVQRLMLLINDLLFVVDLRKMLYLGQIISLIFLF